MKVLLVLLLLLFFHNICYKNSFTDPTYMHEGSATLAFFFADTNCTTISQIYNNLVLQLQHVKKLLMYTKAQS